jgi:ABC-type phosphate/phosphonate transport system substrate-binding protein
MRRSILTAALAVSALSALPSYAAAPKEINFGIISTESSKNLSKDFEPFHPRQGLLCL